MNTTVETLSPEQRAVVEAPLGTARKVVAGAGTGKTKTMVERFAHLVSPGVGLNPGRIMVVTFTNKAAAELRERITEKLLSSGLAAERASLDNAWFGTFHALCTRLLREDCYQVGFDRDIQVINPLEERLLIQEVQRELRDGRIERARILEIEAIDVDDTAKLSGATFDLIRSLKSRGILHEELMQRCIQTGKAFWEAWRQTGSDSSIDQVADEEARELVCATFAEYERRLRERRLIDFDGLLIAARDALRNYPQWAQERRDFFQHLIVDEFQDTNRLQLEVLAALAQPGLSNLEVVGDPRQSIYGWRDAEIKNILDFAGMEHQLTGNYRSPQPILDAAHHIISADSRFADGPLHATRGAGSATSVNLYRGDSPEQEASFIAGRILQLHEDEGRAWSDIAILTRMRRPPIAFEKELRRVGIPYVTGGGYGFFEREEIKDVMAFVRVLDDPLDDAALIRILQGQVVRVTDGELYRLLVGRKDGKHCWDLLLERLASETQLIEPATKERIEVSIQLIGEGQKRRAGMSISQVVQWVLDSTGYPAIAAADPSAAARRMGNLRKLYRMAAEYESSAAFTGLREFIEYVDLHGEHGVDVGEAETEGADAVTLMTIHAAKGLGFPVVFLAHLKPFHNKGEQWTVRYDEGLGLVVRKLDHKETPKMIEMINRGPENMPLQQEREEMRRLVYVAITRAQEQLFVTATRKNEGDWKSVVSELDHKSNPRKHPEDDYFRNLVVWASGGGGTLLEHAGPEGRTWRTVEGAEVLGQGAELIPATSTDDPRLAAADRVQVSFSTMEVFLQCPLRYQYREEWKIPAPPDALTPISQESAAPPRVSAAQLGTLVHATLEAFHQPGLMDGKGGLERLREIWDTVCGGELDRQLAVDLWTGRASSMFANYLASDVASWPTIATEQEFNLAYDGAIIRGFIDRLAAAPAGTTTVVDYKTGRVGRDSGYGTQLGIYIDAMRAQGVHIDALLFDMREGSVIRPNAGMSALAVLDLMRMASRDAGAAPPCRSCGYRRSCAEADARY